MAQVTKSDIIIEEIEKNADMSVRKFPWTELSAEDKGVLFSCVDKWGDDSKVKILLRYISKASTRNDIESHTKALILMFSNPQFKEKKDIIERNCIKLLDGLRVQTKDSGTEGISKYQFYLADFCTIKAQHLFEDGKFQESKSSYQKALKTYNQIAMQDAALAEKKRIVQEYIEKIKSLISENIQIVSVDKLRNERLELLDEVRNHTNVLKQVTEEYKSLQTKIKEGEDAISHIKKKYTDENKKLELLREKIKVNQNALQFLVALPQLTMAPLWLEVIRLALEKGEIDEFTIKCIEGLRTSCPKDAGPLLAEIAVRTQTTIPISSKAAQLRFERFFDLIEKAQSLEATDEIEAAKKLVEAWDMLYSKPKLIEENR